MSIKNNNILIFSLATYGYDVIRDKCIQSQKDYCAKNGYQYFCITHIPHFFSRNQVVWSKLPLVTKALKTYKWVVFLDSDCFIQKGCPPIESLEKKDKYLYFAPGFSGRINSGVIIVRQSDESIALLDQITANKDKKLPNEDSVGWVFGGGENGHIIHYCKNNPLVEIIDKKRNNNGDPSMKDYIRHYSGGGPMWGEYKLSMKGKIQAIYIAIRTFYKKVKKKLGLSQGHISEETHSLEDLVTYCITHYPLLQGPDKK